MNIKKKGIAWRWKRAIGRRALLNMSSCSTADNVFLAKEVYMYMSRVMRKPTFWFPTRSNTNQAVQLQKMARGLRFWISKVEGVYYP